jgi:tetratricopeptide (TPR) repeat protein
VKLGKHIAVLLLAIPAAGMELRADPAPQDGVDRGVIRFGAPAGQTAAPAAAETIHLGEPRRGFDYASFESRLESLWFQRKTLLASGREQDATAQLERIRALCSAEGVKRLEHLSGALVAEALRYLEEGNGPLVFAALQHAEAFDPGRPQTHLVRARAHWKMDRAALPAAAELFAVGRTSLLRSLQELRLFHRLAFVAALGLIATGLTFVAAMLVRYHRAFRHEVQERSARTGWLGWSGPIGWLFLALPLALWVGAGWTAVYLLVVLFRFMTGTERLAAVAMLALGAVAWPLYGLVVGLYGTSADPAVRTTLTSVGGEYDPDRIVRLRGLVESHPDDPVYRFLLAGMYRNGRYFEEAFEEYRKVLELEPSNAMAWINIGNIFYTTSQFSEAIANYRKALELQPDSFLAHFNLHLAESEDFRFNAAEESLERARRIDAERVARVFSQSGDRDQHLSVLEATPELAPLWEAAVAGRTGVRTSKQHGHERSPRWWANPAAIVCGTALAGSCVLLLLGGRPSARGCVRCGRPFCARCKRGDKAPDCCTQCMHLFVLRDGLAPETKSRKLYEVRRHETRGRLLRRIASAVVPGAVHVERGRTVPGLLLVFGWCAAWVAARPDLLPVREFAGLSLSRDLLSGAIEVPATPAAGTLMLLAFVALPLLWLAGNVWQLRRRSI